MEGRSRYVFGAGVLLPGLILAGCTRTPPPPVATSAEGRYVGEATVAKLKSGNSDRTWLLLLLGEPDDKSTDALTGLQTWRWTYRRTARERRMSAPTSVFERDVLVELRHETIVRAWSEERSFAEAPPAEAGDGSG